MPDGRFVIEQAPAGMRGERGVVAEGAVGAARRAASLFRYEIRRWRDGVIPDVAEAVDSPQRLSDDPDSRGGAGTGAAGADACLGPR